MFSANSEGDGHLCGQRAAGWTDSHTHTQPSYQRRHPSDELQRTPAHFERFRRSHSQGSPAQGSLPRFRTAPQPRHVGGHRAQQTMDACPMRAGHGRPSPTELRHLPAWQAAVQNMAPLLSGDVTPESAPESLGRQGTSPPTQKKTDCFCFACQGMS